MSWASSTIENTEKQIPSSVGWMAVGKIGGIGTNIADIWQAAHEERPRAQILAALASSKAVAFKLGEIIPKIAKFTCKGRGASGVVLCVASVGVVAYGILKAEKGTKDLVDGLTEPNPPGTGVSEPPLSLWRVEVVGAQDQAPAEQCGQADYEGDNWATQVAFEFGLVDPSRAAERGPKDGNFSCDEPKRLPEGDVPEASQSATGVYFSQLCSWMGPQTEANLPWLRYTVQIMVGVSKQSADEIDISVVSHAKAPAVYDSDVKYRLLRVSDPSECQVSQQ